MADHIVDFWPEITTESTQVTPVTILRQQAAALAKKTNNLLLGEVKTGPSPQGFEHSFFIVAPALDYYRYELFRIFHGIEFYPLSVELPGEKVFAKLSGKAFEPKKLQNEAEFAAWLRERLQSTDTKQVIESLLALVASFSLGLATRGGRRRMLGWRDRRRRGLGFLELADVHVPTTPMWDSGQRNGFSTLMPK